MPPPPLLLLLLLSWPHLEEVHVSRVDGCFLL
jgi:hypothetical protein